MQVILTYAGPAGRAARLRQPALTLQCECITYVEGQIDKALEMGVLLEIEATITERGQTTVPSAIRKALGVDRNDKLLFRQMDDGSVVIAPKLDQREGSDPVIAKFLAFLERDMSNHPETLVPSRQELFDRGEKLVEGVEVDLDKPLADE